MDKDNWIEWRDWAADGRCPVDGLCVIYVRNRHDDEFGPILAGMLKPESFAGDAFHASCDIIAYRLDTPSHG